MKNIKELYDGTKRFSSKRYKVIDIKSNEFMITTKGGKQFKIVTDDKITGVGTGSSSFDLKIKEVKDMRDNTIATDIGCITLYSKYSLYRFVLEFIKYKHPDEFLKIKEALLTDKQKEKFNSSEIKINITDTEILSDELSIYYDEATKKLEEIKEEYDKFLETVVIDDNASITLENGSSAIIAEFVDSSLDNTTIRSFNNIGYPNCRLRLSRVIENYVKEKDIKYIDMDWGDYAHSYTYKITYKQLVEIYNRYLDELKEDERLKQHKKDRELKRRRNLQEEAKILGEKVVLKTYIVECNDPHEECNFDKITDYIDGEGNITTERIHTF